SAIWLRAELWMQRNSTRRGGSSTKATGWRGDGRSLMVESSRNEVSTGAHLGHGHGSHRDLVLAEQLLHQLRAARGRTSVAIVEEEVHAPGPLGELADLTDPLLQLLAAIVVV